MSLVGVLFARERHVDLAHQTGDPIHLLLLGVVCVIGWYPICQRQGMQIRPHGLVEIGLVGIKD